MTNRLQGLPSAVQVTFLLRSDVLTCVKMQGHIELIAGYDINDFLSATLSFPEIFHPDDIDIREEIFSHSPQVLPLTLTFRIINKSGQVKIIRATYSKHVDIHHQQTQISMTLNMPKGLSSDIVNENALNNYIAMLENTDDYIYFKNRDHQFTGASQTLVGLTHGTSLWTDLIGKDDYDVFPREFADIYYTLEKKIFSGSVSVAKEIQPVLDRNGKPGWVDNRKYAMADKEGNIIGLFGVARDVTTLVETEKALRKSEERIRLAFLAANQAWFDLDVTTGEVVVSEEYPRMLGFDETSFHTDLQEWQQNIHPDDLESVMAALQECKVAGGPVSMEYRRRHKNGSWLWLYAVGKVAEWSEQHEALRMIGIHTNIMARKKLELELEQKAYIDYLTEVNNRGHFMEQSEKELVRALRYEKPLAILMLDIDFFKKINDSHGHKLGDIVLKKLADICKQTLREVDIIGRVGGEEFAILLPETDQQLAAEVAERLRAAIADTKIPMKDGLPVQFSVSIGVASLVSKDDNMDVLLNRADQALYEAKETGRNKVCVAVL